MLRRVSQGEIRHAPASPRATDGSTPIPTSFRPDADPAWGPWRSAGTVVREVAVETRPGLAMPDPAERKRRPDPRKLLRKAKP